MLYSAHAVVRWFCGYGVNGIHLDRQNIHDGSHPPTIGPLSETVAAAAIFTV